MNDWFADQMQVAKPLTAEQVAKIKGHTLFGRKPGVNDRVFWLMVSSLAEGTSLKDEIPEVTLTLTYIVESEMEELERKYNYKSSSRSIPEFQNKTDPEQLPAT